MSSQSQNCTWTRLSWNSSYLNNSLFLSGIPPLMANPDVAGIGVVIGFIGSGYMCWILLLVHYLLAYNPRQHSFSQHVNPIDGLILNWFRKRIGWYSLNWGAGLEKCVLILSDQQMVSGIAILGSAYSQLNNNFQLYHWQMSIWLAWFSSVTHLGTLSILRNYLREHPALRTQRLVFMLMIAIMLMVSLLPTGSPSWLRFPGDYVICYIQSLPASWKAPGPEEPGNNIFLAVSTAAIIAYSYLVRIIKMFPSLSAFTRTHLRDKPGRQVKRCLKTLLTLVEAPDLRWSYWTTLIFFNPLLVLFLIARAVFDFMESMLWEVFWLMYALIWVTIRLFALKNMGLATQENTWSFGQWASTLLLVLPVFSIIETLYEAMKELQKSSEDRLELPGGVLERSYDTEAHQITPFALCIASEVGAATVPGNILHRAKTPPYDDNFYQYAWFCRLSLLFLASIIANSTVILNYATSQIFMRYFIGGALYTIVFVFMYFQVVPIFMYPFLFLRIGNFSSPAELLTQKVFNKRSIRAQEKAFNVVSIILLVLAMSCILMQCVYLR